MRRFWPVLVLIIGGLFWWGLQRPGKDDLPSVLVGKPAPNFTLPILSPYQARWGKELEFAKQEGKPVILNLWASWCIPCRTEAPLLERYHQQYGDRVLFLGVNVQDKESDALAFIQQYGLTFPSVFDPRGTVGVEYGMYGVPETFVINRAGQVLKRHAGELSQTSLEGYLELVMQ